MLQMNESMFFSLTAMMKLNYKLDDKTASQINCGFVREGSVFVLRAFVGRLKNADMKFCLDETGIEFFVNDLTIHGKSVAHIIARMYIASDLLIKNWREGEFEGQILISMARCDDFGRVRMHVIRENQRYFRDDVVKNTDVEFGIIRV